MLMMISKVLVFSVLSLGVIVDGVEHGKTSAAVAAKGEVELENSETSQRKSMVRQAPHSRQAIVEIGHDGSSTSLSTSGTNSGEKTFFRTHAGCGDKDLAERKNKCMPANTKRKIGFRCCTALNAESEKVLMEDYGCKKRIKVGGKVVVKGTCRNCKNKNHDQAVKYCAEWKLKLCDVADLKHIECGTGCKMDRKRVWTSTKCDAEEVAGLLETEEDEEVHAVEEDGGDVDGGDGDEDDDDDDEVAAAN